MFKTPVFRMPNISFPAITGAQNSSNVRAMEKRQVLGNFGFGRTPPGVGWTYAPSHELPDGFEIQKGAMYEIR